MKLLEYIGIDYQKKFMEIGKQLNRTEEENKRLYIKLIGEELSELSLSYDDLNPQDSLTYTEDQLDAFADILVVILGYYSIGEIPKDLDIDTSVWEEHLKYLNNKPAELIESDLLFYLFALGNILGKDTSPDFEKYESALVNIVYSILFLFNLYKLNVRSIMEEVFSSNMSKFELDQNGNLYAILRDDGKILKGKNFRLPSWKIFLKTKE